MTIKHSSSRNKSNLPISSTSAKKHSKSRISIRPASSFNKAKSVKEFCEEYAISIASFYRNIDTMPESIMVGKQRRIRREDEEKWLANQ